MSDTNLNLEFCCTCLKVGAAGDKFVSLNFAPPEDISYKTKLKSCVPEMGLENTDDCFLCQPCSVALQTAYTFRCMCLRTESRLEEFRISQNKNYGLSNKSIKQELIESACVVEETTFVVTETHSTGLSVQSLERYPTGVSIQCEYPIAVATQSDDFSSQPPALQPAATTITTTISTQPERVSAPDLSTEESTDRDSKIEIVKDELGSLLTESLEGAIDINVQIFDKNSKHSTNTHSRTSIFDSLDVEMEDLKKKPHHRVDLPKENKQFDLQEKSGQLNLSKEVKENIKTSTSSVPVPSLKRKKLSDAEIVEICCKTIPDLHNCTPKSLDCQVALEKITVSNIPAKISKRKRTHAFSPKKSYKGKAFWCAICHKDVYRKDRFNAHILRHSNIRAYKCNTCKEGFFSGETLNKHKKGCVGSNQNVSSVSDNTNVPTDSIMVSDTTNASVASNMSDDTATVSATSPKIPEKKVVKKPANRLKVGKISSTTHVKKKNPIKGDENVVERKSTNSVNRLIKIEKSTSFKDATNFSNKSRKSPRKPASSKRLCNMTDIIYRCKECNYQSYYKQKFQVHLLHHSNHRPFECSECPEKFFERWILNRHIRNVHSNTSSKNDVTSRNVTRNMRKETKNSQQAVVNAKNDSSSWEANSLPTFVEPAISLIVNPGTLVTPIIQSIHSLAETSMQDNSIEMSFACKLCNISFKSRNLLLLHTQTHELRRKCGVCGKEFDSEAAFLEHGCTSDVPVDAKESVELESPPKLPKKKKKKRKFFCNICNMEFSSRDHANVHTGAKPYTCKVCSKQFAAYNTLRKHNLVHQKDDEATGSQKKGRRKISPQRRTFSCEICKKKFVNKDYVYSHNCHSASGDTVYRCQICKNAFIGRAALIEHMGIHVSQNENATE